MKTWTADELRAFLGFVADDDLYAAWHLDGPHRAAPRRAARAPVDRPRPRHRARVGPADGRQRRLPDRDRGTQDGERPEGGRARQRLGSDPQVAPQAPNGAAHGVRRSLPGSRSRVLSPGWDADPSAATERSLRPSRRAIRASSNPPPRPPPYARPLPCGPACLSRS